MGKLPLTTPNCPISGNPKEIIRNCDKNHSDCEIISSFEYLLAVPLVPNDCQNVWELFQSTFEEFEHDF